MIGGTGLVMMGLDETWKKDAAAQAQGYASHAEQTRAASLGFATPSQLSAHDAKLAEEKAATVAKARADAAEAEWKKEAACRADLQCWGDKHGIGASIACRPYVERLAKYQFEWTDGWLETKFSRFRWRNKEKGQLTYLGDRIKFQNGFGAWQFAIYTCDYDPISGVVMNVDASPGRLPQ